MTKADPLDALEQRISRLEARLSESDPVTIPAEVLETGTLWALEGLRLRTDELGAVLLVGHVRLPDGRISQWQEASDTGALLDDDWAEAADVLAALGNPVRLHLLRRVLDGACTVTELTEVDGVGTSGQVYHHLRQLTAAGWLRGVGGGRHEVPVARVIPLLTLMLGARR